MAKETSRQVEVTIDIQPGPASPAQNEAWTKFWQLVILETQKEAREADPVINEVHNG
jgi:hypothetical protein